MKRRADAVGPATRQSSRLQKMQATAGAAVREPAPQEDPEQLLRARRAARELSFVVVLATVLGLGAASGNQIDSLRNTTEHARLSALCRWAGALTHKKVGGGAIQPAAPSLPFPSLPFNRSAL